MSASYFTAAQRREALLKWLRRTYSDSGMFNTAEASTGAVDIFTPLYEGPNAGRQCGRDLSLLKREGYLARLGSQWVLKLPCPSNYGCSNEASEEHGCPYAEEINDDQEYTCRCCADCVGECCAEI